MSVVLPAIQVKTFPMLWLCVMSAIRASRDAASKGVDEDKLVSCSSHVITAVKSACVYRTLENSPLLTDSIHRWPLSRGGFLPAELWPCVDVRLG